MYQTISNMKTSIEGLHRDVRIPFYYILNNTLPSIPIEQAQLIVHIIIQSIEAYLFGRYNAFDAHTTTNCCHGLAVRVANVIRTVPASHLPSLLQEGRNYAKLLSQHQGALDPLRHETWEIPRPIARLAEFYILSYVGISDSQKTRRIDSVKLQDIAPVSRRFCDNLVKHLQIKIANQVAESYQYLDILPNVTSAGISASKWQTYVHSRHIRTDRRGRKYTACMYSMQVVLGYIKSHGLPFAIVSDIIGDDANHIGRYVKLFKGDTRSGTYPVSLQSRELNRLQPWEPTIVFSGTSVQDKSIAVSNLDAWSSNIDSLILANDIHYPQFPMVRDDPAFNSTPVTVNDDEIQQAIENHRTIRGVSAEDRSLFCLAHIYVASLPQVLLEIRGQTSLTSWRTGISYSM